ncbi:MFS multidrug transporter [Gautieria morchelliformis]|nr:MFS multidrug transporter [Gautieria morchelliformis]
METRKLTGLGVTASLTRRALGHRHHVPPQSSKNIPPETEQGASWREEKRESTVAVDIYHSDEASKNSSLQPDNFTLEPIPSRSPADPLNWPIWRKNILLGIVAVHTMQGTVSAAITIPAFMDLSKEFGVSLNTAAFTTSVPIIFLGVMPIIWSPISARVGRRPIYLISAIVAAGCSLAGSFCHSYATLMITRIVQAIFLAPPMSIGACSVREMFFAHERGQKMGVWVLMVTLGPPLGPIIAGYLVQFKGWRAAFYLLAAVQLAIFVAHVFLGPETLFLGRGETDEEVEPSLPQKRKRWHQYVHFSIYDRTPLQTIEFIRPFFMFARPVVLLPAMAYAFVFAYAHVFVTVFVPQIFGQKFGLTPGQIGLQMFAQLIGGVLGELFAGRGSDAFVSWRAKRTGSRVPEYRLTLAYPGFLISITGLIVWGVQLQNATPKVWNITPDIGAAIAVFGQQIVGTVCCTYAIESYISETASVSAFLTFFVQSWNFLAPFYLGHAVTNLGTAKAVGLFSSIMGIGMFMVIACNIWGPRWRNG